MRHGCFLAVRTQRQKAPLQYANRLTCVHRFPSVVVCGTETCSLSLQTLAVFLSFLTHFLFFISACNWSAWSRFSTKTLKESFIKAIGTGLGFNLQRAEFHLSAEPLTQGTVLHQTKMHLDEEPEEEWIFEVSLFWKVIIRFYLLFQVPFWFSWLITESRSSEKNRKVSCHRLIFSPKWLFSPKGLKYPLLTDDTFTLHHLFMFCFKFKTKSLSKSKGTEGWSIFL